MDVGVIALEGLHERLGHAVGLRAPYWSEARCKPQPDGELDRLVSSIRTAIVREPLDGMRSGGSAEALLHALEHQIPDHLAADATGTGTPGHDFPIAGVQSKDHT